MDPLYKQHQHMENIIKKKKSNIKNKQKDKAKHNRANKYPLQFGCFMVRETL